MADDGAAAPRRGGGLRARRRSPPRRQPSSRYPTRASRAGGSVRTPSGTSTSTCSCARASTCLDLYGMYDMRTTIFPNALLYFATSASHPEVGVSAADRARNPPRPACRRPGRVARHPRRPDDVPPDTDPLGLSTRRSPTRRTSRATPARWLRCARAVPEPWAMGFRIGERAAGALVRRHLHPRRARRRHRRARLPPHLAGRAPRRARAARGRGRRVVAEAKFNGEQPGAPYPVEGGTGPGPGRSTPTSRTRREARLRLRLPGARWRDAPDLPPRPTPSRAARWRPPPWAARRAFARTDARLLPAAHVLQRRAGRRLLALDPSVATSSPTSLGRLRTTPRRPSAPSARCSRGASAPTRSGSRCRLRAKWSPGSSRG